MKPDRITKVYGDLTNKERAALVFHYWTDLNEVEVERIVATVPRKSYQQVDAEYEAWLDAFTRMADCWAIEYWQTHSRKQTALVMYFACHTRGDCQQEEASLEECYCWESRLLALDRALEAVCLEHGLEVDGVRVLAGTKPTVSILRNVVPDAEYQAAIEANLSAVLNNRENDVYRLSIEQTHCDARTFRWTAGTAWSY